MLLRACADLQVLCLSHVTRHTSHVSRHTSHVTRLTSHVTRHTSHVTRLTSRASSHPPYSSSDRDCSYLIKLGCCKILRQLYEFRHVHARASDATSKASAAAADALDDTGSSSATSAAAASARAAVVPVAMVSSGFAVMQQVLRAGHVAAACASGLLDDIGNRPCPHQHCRLFLLLCYLRHSHLWLRRAVCAFGAVGCGYRIPKTTTRKSL
jgi:hypothetical protein